MRERERVVSAQRLSSNNATHRKENTRSAPPLFRIESPVAFKIITYEILKIAFMPFPGEVESRWEELKNRETPQKHKIPVAQ